MSPPLSHPFRPASTSGTVQASYDTPRHPAADSTPTNSTGENTAPQGDSYYSPEEVESRAQRKLKIVGGCVAALLLYSILSTAVFDLLAIFGFSTEQSASGEGSLAASLQDEDEVPLASDRELQNIRQERAQAVDKVGFFDSIFCSGRRRSAFCD